MLLYKQVVKVLIVAANGHTSPLKHDRTCSTKVGIKSLTQHSPTQFPCSHFFFPLILWSNYKSNSFPSILPRSNGVIKPYLLVIQYTKLIQTVLFKISDVVILPLS